MREVGLATLTLSLTDSQSVDPREGNAARTRLCPHATTPAAPVAGSFIVAHVHNVNVVEMYLFVHTCMQIDTIDHEIHKYRCVCIFKSHAYQTRLMEYIGKVLVSGNELVRQVHRYGNCPAQPISFRVYNGVATCYVFRNTFMHSFPQKFFEAANVSIKVNMRFHITH